MAAELQRIALQQQSAVRSEAQEASTEAASSVAAKLWSSGVVLLTLAGLMSGVVLAPEVSGSSATISPNGGGVLEWLLFVGTAVHVAATGCLFLVPEVRHIARRDRWNFYGCPFGLVVTASLVSVLISPSSMAKVLLAVFAWQFWHYQRQNLGMVALVTSCHRLPSLNRKERGAIMGAGAAGVLGLVAHPQLLGLNLHLSVQPVWAIAGVSFAGSTCYGLILLVRRSRLDRPYAFSALYVLSLLFWAPMFMFGSSYAAVGGMTIAHGFQYLLMVGLVLAGRPSSSSRMVGAGAALNMALVAGALLSSASHLHGSPAPLRDLFGAYVGVLMVHFVMDRRLWRLRDPTVRRFLASRIPYLIPARDVPVSGGSSAGIGYP